MALDRPRPLSHPKPLLGNANVTVVESPDAHGSGRTWTSVWDLAGMRGDRAGRPYRGSTPLTTP
jgi:hypothetical protein